MGDTSHDISSPPQGVCLKVPTTAIDEITMGMNNAFPILIRYATKLGMQDPLPWATYTLHVIATQTLAGISDHAAEHLNKIVDKMMSEQSNAAG